MSDLFLLNESLTNNSTPSFLLLISLASILCGVFVIISKNPIVSILFLIGLFLSISSYLMMLGINFIGLSYLLVYVGAVSILFLFILMLINVRISELVTDNNNSVPLAVIIGILFNLTTYNILPYNNTTIKHIFGINYDVYNWFNIDYYLTKGNLNLFKDDDVMNQVMFVTSKVWDSNLSETSHITSIGNTIYTVYPMWLIITSIILLLAMVGAIVITIKQK